MSDSRNVKTVVFSSKLMNAEQVCQRYVEGVCSDAKEDISSDSYKKRDFYTKQVSPHLKLEMNICQFFHQMEIKKFTEQRESALLIIDAANINDIDINMDVIAMYLGRFYSRKSFFVLAATNISQVSKETANRVLMKMQSLQKIQNIESLWLVDPKTNLNIDNMFNHIATLATLEEYKNKMLECVNNFKRMHTNKDVIKKIDELLLLTESDLSYPEFKSIIVKLQQTCKISRFSIFSAKISDNLDINKVFDKQGALVQMNPENPGSTLSRVVEHPEGKKEDEKTSLQSSLLAPLNVGQVESEAALEARKGSCFSGICRKFC